MESAVPITLDQQTALFALCNRYLDSNEDFSLIALDKEVAALFSCDTANKAPGAIRAMDWLEKCQEAHRDESPAVLFPPEFVVTQEKQVTAAQDSTVGSKAGTKLKGKNKPRAIYNQARCPVAGTKHYYGDCPAHALNESQVSFMGDKEEPGVDQLQVRAATNFRFVDKGGCDVSVGHGATGENPIYLIAACGSLNPNTESGQRLAAGWWNSDPDPKQMKLKAPAEIIWLKIPVQYVGPDADIQFRGEASNVMTADGEQGVYVLQCPDPGYANRWEITCKNFNGAKKFKGTLPEGACPDWFQESLWEDLVEEYGRWKNAHFDVNPPAPPKLDKAEMALLKLECDVAWNEAIIRNSNEGIKWCEVKLDAHAPVAPKTRRAWRVITIQGTVNAKASVKFSKTKRVFEAEKASAVTKLDSLTGRLQQAKKKWGSRLRTEAQKSDIPVSPPTSSDESDDDRCSDMDLSS